MRLRAAFPLTRLIACLFFLAAVNCDSEPEATAWLEVTELSDESRKAIHDQLSPSIRVALGDDGIIVSTPITVPSPEAKKATRPGPASWRVLIPIMDTRTGTGFLARVTQDRQNFSIEPIAGVAAFTSTEAAEAISLAKGNPEFSTLIHEFESAGHTTQLGAMVATSSLGCSGRCAEIRLLASGYGDDHHGVRLIARGVFSLGTGELTSIDVPTWVDQ